MRLNLSSSSYPLFGLILGFYLILAPPSVAQDKIQQKTQGMKAYPGYFNFYWDEKEGKIWLEIDKFEQEFLHVNSLPAGVGSNDIGLDRGQLGGERVVKFQRVGPKVLLVQPNLDYRALSERAAEKASVEEAFAQSVLAGFKVEAEAPGKVLVDFTAFLMQDAHGVGPRLARSGQGTYKLDPKRSALYLARTKNFPKNSEFEITLTFSGAAKGRYIRQVSPNPNIVTVRQHHSLIELPDDQYQARSFDPRSGYYALSFVDFASPLDEKKEKRFITRHRLEKKNPEQAISEAKEPIVYYLDPGIPDEIREAMREGGNWWNQAFEAAGFKNAFFVKDLPEDADPMDVRYNVVQWVHRATRGWSYGSSVTDPRTGEIIKGHVTLGSLRLRQDYLIAEGLLSPYKTEGEVPKAMKEIALARLRQLVAHEIGHTIGLSHNFAASTNDRASVMDYPHPYFTLNGKGEILWEDAYDRGIGEWDKVSIRYGYSVFPKSTDESQALKTILEEAFSKGLRYISDADARPTGGAHPYAHLWDNGASASEELKRVLVLRKKALDNFSEQNIPFGQPLSSLEDVLVPVYLMHRYQVEATVKLIGGIEYTYALRGGTNAPLKAISSEEQSEALDMLIESMNPEALAIPNKILAIIPPSAMSYGRGRENFKNYTGPTFDPLAAAEIGADVPISLLLHPARLARVLEHEARGLNTEFGLKKLLNTLDQKVFRKRGSNPYLQQVQRVVQKVLVYRMIQSAHSEATTDLVKSYLYQQLRIWKGVLEEQDPFESLYLSQQIQQFFDHPQSLEMPSIPNPPAGSPIGCGY